MKFFSSFLKPTVKFCTSEKVTKAATQIVQESKKATNSNSTTKNLFNDLPVNKIELEKQHKMLEALSKINHSFGC